MSWDIELEGAGNVPHFEEGGTHVMGGTTTAELNITYNYSAVYRLFGFHIREDLDGKRAGDMIQRMKEIVKKCGTEKYRDYWAATPGNAGFALNILAEWAEQYPDSIFRVR